MKKKYIAPQVEATQLGTQTIICASAPSGLLPVFDPGSGGTSDQW